MSPKTCALGGITVSQALAGGFILLRQPEKLAGASHAVSETKESEGGYCTLHRTVLRSTQNSVRTRPTHEVRTEHLSSQLAA